MTSAPPASPRNELEWLGLQIRTLYEEDAEGRIVRFNGPPADRAPAPYLFFGRTRLGNLWRLRGDLEDTLVRELARLLGAERRSEKLAARPEREAVLLERLGRHHVVSSVWSGPAFRFPEALPEPGSAPGIRPLAAEELPAAARRFPELAPTLPARMPVHGAEREGEIVSLCYCATRAGRGCEAGVVTAPGWRGRGLAAGVTASWAADLRARGIEPLYSTGWENRSSRAVARRLGLIPYASDFHIR